MKLLARADHLVLATIWAESLRAAGIRCELRNTTLSGAIGEIPFLECAPQLWIERDADESRALEILQATAATGTWDRSWHCTACGETSEPQFGACWQCGAARPRLSRSLSRELAAWPAVSSSSSASQSSRARQTRPTTARTAAGRRLGQSCAFVAGFVEVPRAASASDISRRPSAPLAAARISVRASGAGSPSVPRTARHLTPAVDRALRSRRRSHSPARSAAPAPSRSRRRPCARTRRSDPAASAAAARGSRPGRNARPVDRSTAPIGPGSNDEPEEHAEDVALRQQQPVLDRLPHDFLLRQIGRAEGRIAEPLPRGQFAPGRRQVAIGQRNLDLAAVMAELPETEREIQHEHVERQAEEPADRDQQRLHRADGEREADDHQQPGIEAVTRPTGIEVAFGPRRDSAEPTRTPGCSPATRAVARAAA